MRWKMGLIFWRKKLHVLDQKGKKEERKEPKEEKGKKNVAPISFFHVSFCSAIQRAEWKHIHTQPYIKGGEFMQRKKNSYTDREQEKNAEIYQKKNIQGFAL